MAHFEQDTDVIISIDGRSWRFPGAQIETDSWEVEWRSDGKLYLHDDVGNVVEGTELNEPDMAVVLAKSSPRERSGGIKDHACCYYQCLEPGTIHIGTNGSDSHWICFRHLDRWNQARARFIAQGLPCEMEELGELLRYKCRSEAKNRALR